MKKIAIYKKEERTQKQGWNVVFNNLLLLDTTIARLTEKCKRFLKKFSYRSRKITLFHKMLQRVTGESGAWGTALPAGSPVPQEPGGLCSGKMHPALYKHRALC